MEEVTDFVSGEHYPVPASPRSVFTSQLDATSVLRGKV